MSGKVLVVDDSRTARMMCIAALRRQRPDLSIIEAGDGAAALVAVGQTRPDYAILDQNMPGMDGIELARQLRLRVPDLPISVLTANVQGATRLAAEASKVYFFRKPITEEILTEILTAMGC